MELKPCGFCHSKEVRYVVHFDAVCCSICHARGPRAETRELAERAWNTRAVVWQPIEPSKLKDLFMAAGGDQHGPHIEIYDIAESDWAKFVEQINSHFMPASERSE